MEEPLQFAEIKETQQRHIKQDAGLNPRIEKNRHLGRN